MLLRPRLVSQLAAASPIKALTPCNSNHSSLYPSRASAASNSKRSSSPRLLQESLLPQRRWISGEQTARDLSQQGVDEQLSEFNTPHAKAAAGEEPQTRAPWHREGHDQPPVRRQRSAGAMVKGMSNYKRSGHCSSSQESCSPRHRVC